MIDVLIVGAGPVGLFLAGELARRGIGVRIVEQNAVRSQESKALGIVPRTLEILEMAGAVDAFVRAGFAVRAVNLLDRREPLARLTFESLASPYQFMLIVPQSTTEELLEKRLTALGVTLERERQMLSFAQSDEGVTTTVQTGGRIETIQSQWVVGCDGAHSMVRHALNLPFVGEAYEEGFVLADVDLEARAPGDEIFLSIGPRLFALFPMFAARYRIIMTVDRHDHHEPSLEELQKLFDDRSPFQGRIAQVRWVSNFRVHRRMVPQMQFGRAFLAGDAAHIHSPAGGQGMNTGLGDAWNLAWKLALVCKGGAPRSLLLSYHEERFPVAREVLRATNLLTRGAFVIGNPLLRPVRSFAIPRVFARTKVRERIVETVAELDVAYPKSPIVFGSGRRPAPCRVRDKRSGMAGPLTSLLGRNHVLLFWSKPKVAIDEMTASMASALKRQYGERLDVYIVESSEPIASIVLLRPDGYLGFEGTHDQIDEMHAVLKKNLA